MERRVFFNIRTCLGLRIESLVILIVRKVSVDNRNNDVGVISRVAFRIAILTRAITTITLLGFFFFLLFVTVDEVDLKLQGADWPRFRSWQFSLSLEDILPT